MDINAVRVAIELCTFVAFIAIVAWAWSSRRGADFESASHLPFEGDDSRLDHREGA